MSIEENEALVRRAFEAWNTGNLDTALELVATNYMRHDSATPEINGHGGYAQVFTLYHTAFPDTHLTIEDMIAAGDRVVVRWTGRGTHRGELQGITPTGKAVTVTGIGIFRTTAGKIAEEWENWDLLGLLQQLGVIPPQGTGGI